MPRLTLVGTRFRAFAALVLLAWLARALVPAGYMPATTTEAALPGLAICSQGLPGAAPLLTLSPQSEHAPEAPLMQHCVLGGVLSLAALPPSLGLSAVASWAWWLLPQARPDTLFHRLLAVAGPPLGSRAPPLLAVSTLLSH